MLLRFRSRKSAVGGGAVSLSAPRSSGKLSGDARVPARAGHPDPAAVGPEPECSRVR